ncbi:hypothetical protein FEM48_Zijuj07G0018400 [Ziziphus jujuba var. spinosa]|uniref:Uncharacterized protein n=1 Tax=Ziziphus jujuba var. spinosa TaxID=714518 RepID=A0A978V1R8_ZIZJJ|nr:hypothetical protein FEM48_Zijuj07G0018400 [Ziziphus jujuba var. spinosa]
MRFSPWDIPLLSNSYTYSNFQCFLQSVTPTIHVPSKESSESWSTDDSESSSDDQISVSLSNYSSRNSDITSTSDDFIHDRLHDHEHEHDHHDHHNHDRNTVDHFGHLYCQYNETSSPHDRLPLTEKINELAENYPGLLKFQSRDLSPYSWMAIACSMAKEDEKYFKCTSLMELCEEGEKFTMKEEEGSGTSFSPFGVATYKMFGELWINSNVSDEERVGSYLNAANSWLKQHKFQHHDFNFFMSRRYF